MASIFTQKQKVLDVDYVKDNISPRSIQFRENKLITQLRQSSRKMTPYSRLYISIEIGYLFQSSGRNNPRSGTYTTAMLEVVNFMNA